MSKSEEERFELITHVARALIGDNLFRGFSVREDLVGRSYTSLYALAIGGPVLNARQEKILDALTACGLAADPRIWPVKVSTLTASYGNAMAGYSAAASFFDGMLVSPFQCRSAAQTLLRCKNLLREQPLNEILDQWPGRIAGFGVPTRRKDERLEALSRWYEAYTQEEERPHWELIAKIIKASGEKLRPNIGVGTAAVGLDLGFDAQQCGFLGCLYCLLCVLSTSIEHAELSPSEMQIYPESLLIYKGNGPRTSSRHLGRNDVEQLS